MRKARKPGKGASPVPPAFKFDVHPDLSTMAALERLQAVWGGSFGMAVTAVLDAWTGHALADAMELQGFVAQVHPEWRDKPLFSLPPHVFMAAIAAQDLADAVPQGRA